MHRAALAAAAVFVIGGATIAVAQPGGVFPGSDEGEERSAAARAYAECVSEAAKAGDDPEELCAELRPGSELGEDAGDEANGGEPQGNANGSGKSGETHAAACADQPKEDGSFGKCVSEKASAFGKCVSQAAQTGSGNPTDACAHLKPSNGAGPENASAGRPEGVPSGKPEGTPGGKPDNVPSGKPEGTPSGPPAGVPSGKPEGVPGG